MMGLRMVGNEKGEDIESEHKGICGVRVYTHYGNAALIKWL